MKQKHTILLVEDEKESANMLSNFLEMHGYRVLVAYEGDRAIEIIEQEAEAIHVAILDIMVPNVNGKEICRRIRRHPVLNDIPVIFLTAKDQEQDEIDGLELGADSYIAKPASLDLIKTHVETLLRRQNPQTANWLRYGDAYLNIEGKELYIMIKK